MNRREFVKVSAALCLVPSVSVADRPVKVFQDGEGETYIAHSLDELLTWLRDDVGATHIPELDDWDELTEEEAATETLRLDDNTRQTFAAARQEVIDGGYPIPTQIATTYC